jgi:RNA polymerase sigma-70 factor (ECF subfamily)
LVRLKLGSTLRRRVDSQDVVQEVLLDASKLYIEGRVGPFGEGAEFLRWLATAIDRKVRNLARFHAAARRNLLRELPLEPRAAVAEGSKGGRSASSILMEEERREEVLAALEKLSPRQRQVIELVHFRDLKLHEAAAALGKTPNATSVLLYEAMKRLARTLEAGPGQRPAGAGEPEVRG